MQPHDPSPPAGTRGSPLDAALLRNLDAVRGRIRAAAARAGRAPDAARLVAVTKSVGSGIIRRLLAIGISEIGENRIQDAVRKMDEVSEAAIWHLIGHLQANKSRRAVESFDWIHSVDSARLLERVDAHAVELGRTPQVLLQVNVSGEATKHGFEEAGLRETLRATRLAAVRLRGLMTMAPFDEPEAARPVFARLRGLAGELRDEGLVGPDFSELSMGMTNDFEVAVEEGATLVRVGRALYENLPEDDSRKDG